MARTWTNLMAIASLVTIATAASPFDFLRARTGGLSAERNVDFRSLSQRASLRSSEKPEILLGLIATMGRPAPPAKADGRKIAGAMTLAIEDINAAAEILPDYKLRFIVDDDNSTEERSAEVIKKQRREGVLAFFGPEDTCDRAAELAGEWNLPILAYKCNDPALSDKTKYPTFARTQPPATEAARHFLALMRYYQWSKFSIFVEMSEGFPKVAEWLKSMAESQGYGVNHYITVNVFNKTSVRQGIEDTYQDTRVYVVLGRLSMVQSFLAELREQGLTDKGEYVVLGLVDDEPYTEDLADQLLYQGSRFQQDRTEAQAETTLKNVLILSQPETDRDMYRRWEDRVTEKLHEPPINLPANPFSIFNIRAEVPISAAHLYEAVVAYAGALHDVVSNGGSVSNGQAILEQLKGRTYQSPLGYDGQLDGNGDALASYIVVGYQPLDGSSKKAMRPIGAFERDPNNPPEVKYATKINHFNGQAPLDEPTCGYRGQKCRARRQELENHAGQFEN